MIAFLFSNNAFASEQELMQKSYLTIYSVIEFMETGKGIEKACSTAEDKFYAFTNWENSNADALKNMLNIKKSYETKAIQKVGKNAKNAFEKHKNTIMAKVNKTLAPFNNNPKNKIIGACNNWAAAMSNKNSSFRSRIDNEISFFIVERDNIYAAINNNANW